MILCVSKNTIGKKLQKNAQTSDLKTSKGGFRTTSNELKSPIMTVSATMPPVVKTSGHQSSWNGILNENFASKNAAPTDSPAPARQAKLPKKKYSSPLIQRIWARLAPSVRSRTDSFTRWNLDK